MNRCKLKVLHVLLYFYYRASPRNPKVSVHEYTRTLSGDDKKKKIGIHRGKVIINCLHLPT